MTARLAKIAVLASGTEMRGLVLLESAAQTNAAASDASEDELSGPRVTDNCQEAQREALAEREALVAGLKNKEDAAAAKLFDLYHEYVARLLSRLLGYDSELPDAVQDVFLRVYRGIHRMRSPEALTTWMTRVTTLTAIDVLRKRRRRRWLRYISPEAVPELEMDGIDEHGQEALQRTYLLLEKLSPELRVAFSLRKMCGLELTQVAESCGCSLSTAKRRVSTAEAEFINLARRDPVLSTRLGEDAERVSR